MTFVHVHVCACVTCIHVCRWTQEYGCAWKPGKNIKCLAVCHFSPLRQSLPLKLELDLWPTSLSNPSVSILYSSEILGACNQVLLFIWVLRSTFSSSQQACVPTWAVSLAPKFQLLNFLIWEWRQTTLGHFLLSNCCGYTGTLFCSLLILAYTMLQESGSFSQVHVSSRPLIEQYDLPCSPV